MSNRRMKREVLFDRESLSWKMIPEKGIGGGRKKNSLRNLSINYINWGKMKIINY